MSGWFDLTDSAATVLLLAFVRQEMFHRHEPSYPPEHRRAAVECVSECMIKLPWQHRGAYEVTLGIVGSIPTVRNSL